MAPRREARRGLINRIRGIKSMNSDVTHGDAGEMLRVRFIGNFMETCPVLKPFYLKSSA